MQKMPCYVGGGNVTKHKERFFSLKTSQLLNIESFERMPPGFTKPDRFKYSLIVY